MYAAQEDDFGANYIRRFKFASSGSGTTTPPSGTPPPSGNKDSEEGLFDGNCAFGTVRKSGVPWIPAALLAGALLLLARKR